MPERRLKDIDAADRLVRFKAAVWAVAVGFVGGGAAGALLALRAGRNPLLGGLLGALIAGPFVYFLSLFLTERAARAAQQIYNPTDDSTPHRQEYSYAESLVVRERFDDAAAVYELYCMENPENPEPYLRLARLYRDHLHSYQDAIAWFRRARADADLERGQELMAIQETIELYVQKLGSPRKAIPELALLVERFPGTPAAESAQRELAELRQMLARERAGFEPLADQFRKKAEASSVSEEAARARDEMEEQAIRDALRENGGDRHGAALRLGLTFDQLEARMRQLGI